MRKALELGGLVAAVVLIAFGITAIVMGVDGRNTVRDSLRAEMIVASPDMTSAAIAAEAKEAGLPATVELPTRDIAGEPIVTGTLAREFAGYMRIHALEATQGLTYAQMGRFATADGKGTNDAAAALKGEDGQPVANAARNLWVTETALATALNMSYMAEQLALFGIVVGVALLLAGIGFGILAVGGTLRNPEPAFRILGRRTSKKVGATPLPSS
jgi:F0F1-type ATP synthase membrane subunit c/vacuolar-type H+-ATPase subunit K